jgi:hypothetical protein
VGPVTILTRVRWCEPPQMNTSSARDGKEMSTTVNRCSHLDEHNISQEMSKENLHLTHYSGACVLSGMEHLEHINPLHPLKCWKLASSVSSP